MNNQTLQRRDITLDVETLESLMTQGEAPLSDAPAPSLGGAGGAGALTLGLLLTFSPNMSTTGDH